MLFYTYSRELKKIDDTKVLNERIILHFIVHTAIFPLLFSFLVDIWIVLCV